MQDALWEKVVESWVNKYKGRPMTLLMCGRILGGRYGDTMPRLERHVLEGDRLVLFFDEDETLEVVHPQSIELIPEPLPRIFVERGISEDEALVVRQCERLGFNWYYYGRPQAPENLCEEVYEDVPTSGTVVHRESVSWKKKPRLEEFKLGIDEEMLRISPYPDFRLVESSL